MVDYQKDLEPVENETELVEQMAAKTRAIVENEALRNSGGVFATSTVYNNLVLLCSADKYIYALDKRTGEIIWKFLTGGAMVSYPVVRNGVIYVGSYDNYVYALNVSDGSLIWKFRTDDILFSPAVADEYVYAAGLDKCLYALNARTGELVWKFRTGNILVVAPAIVNDMVLLASDDFNVYSLDRKTGSLIWKFHSTGPPTTLALMTASGRMLSDASYHEPIKTREQVMVCFGTWGSDHIFVLDAKTGRLVSHNRMMTGKLFFPTVHDGIFYCGSEDQNMYAFELKTGRILWKFQTGGIISGCPLVHNGVIYFGSYDNYLYALDVKTGAPNWKFRTDGSMTAAPAIDSNILYVGSADAHLYAIDIQKHELIWKFRTSAPPVKLEIAEQLLSFKRLKRAIIRWWQPEKSRLTVYETKPQTAQTNVAASPYTMSEPYKSEVKYQSSSPYEMNKEKKKDWHNPFER